MYVAAQDPAKASFRQQCAKTCGACEAVAAAAAAAAATLPDRVVTEHVIVGDSTRYAPGVVRYTCALARDASTESESCAVLDHVLAPSMSQGARPSTSVVRRAPRATAVAR